MARVFWRSLVSHVGLPFRDFVNVLDVQMRDLVLRLASSGDKQYFLFYEDNVSASLNDQAINLYGNTGATSAYLLHHDGTVTSAIVWSNAARTGGRLEVYVTINGSHIDVTPQVQLDNDNTTVHQVGLDHTIQQADRLTVEIDTTSLWSPTTADIIVGVEVEYD